MIHGNIHGCYRLHKLRQGVKWQCKYLHAFPPIIIAGHNALPPLEPPLVSPR